MAGEEVCDVAVQSLDERIEACRRCPRLVDWRESVSRTKRRGFAEWEYWGKPVPNFGDSGAVRLIVGLAPAAHGANRTGRMFTGDRSGEWLFRALHKVRAASGARSEHRHDGLSLRGVLVTAAVHCAPPGNKPLPEELGACRPYLVELLRSREWRSILCLGSIAWRAVWSSLGERAPCRFAHLAAGRSASGPLVIASYHPSQQNTFTGKLTEPMLDAAILALVEA